VEAKVANAADLIAGLVAILLADSGVAAMAATRVFGGELPAAEAKHMPRTALVVAASGGVSLTGGSYAEHDTGRVDLFAYGSTQHEANLLLAAAAIALRRIKRKVSAGVLIHWAQPAGGGTGGRDPALTWPRAFQSFQVFHALEEV
jgi:hypothetical protein